MSAIYLYTFLSAAVSVASPNPSAKLADSQQTVLEEVLKEEFCGCQSPLSLQACLKKQPNCPWAKQVSAIAQHAAQTGASSSKILGYFSEGLLGPMCRAPLNLAVHDLPQKGPRKAPITFIEVADFRCLHCRHMAPMVEKAVSAMGKDIRFIYVPVPLSDEPMTLQAAQAAFAAHAQGKFWAMHKALFNHPNAEFTRSTLNQLAKKAGLNMKRFAQDMDSQRFLEPALQLRKRVVQAGITATPSFFINGATFEMWPQVCSLEDRFILEKNRSSAGCPIHP